LTTICHPCHKDDGFLTTSQKVIAYLPESQPLPPGFAISQEPQARAEMLLEAAYQQTVGRFSSLFIDATSNRTTLW
jgi:hypothetical protein